MANGWYRSLMVDVYLHARCAPAKSGSGINESVCIWIAAKGGGKPGCALWVAGGEEGRTPERGSHVLQMGLVLPRVAEERGFSLCKLQIQSYPGPFLLAFMMVKMEPRHQWARQCMKHSSGVVSTTGEEH